MSRELIEGVVLGAVGVGILIVGNRIRPAREHEDTFANAVRWLGSLALRSLGVGVVGFGIAALLAEYAIVPEAGEGLGIPQDSFRYRFGVWLGSGTMFFLALICWPLLLVIAVDAHPSRMFLYWASYVTGVSWVVMWDVVAPRVRQAWRRHGR